MFNLTLLLPCSPLTNHVDLVFWIRLTKGLAGDQGSFRSPFFFFFFSSPRPRFFPFPQSGAWFHATRVQRWPYQLNLEGYSTCLIPHPRSPLCPPPAPISSKPCNEISCQLADRRNHWGRLWLKLFQLKLRLLQLLFLIHISLTAWGRISSTVGPSNTSYSTLTQSSVLLSNCVTLQVSVTLIAV